MRAVDSLNTVAAAVRAATVGFATAVGACVCLCSERGFMTLVLALLQLNPSQEAGKTDYIMEEGTATPAAPSISDILY